MWNGWEHRPGEGEGDEEVRVLRGGDTARCPLNLPVRVGYYKAR